MMDRLVHHFRGFVKFMFLAFMSYNLLAISVFINQYQVLRCEVMIFLHPLLKILVDLIRQIHDNLAPDRPPDKGIYNRERHLEFGRPRLGEY